MTSSSPYDRLGRSSSEFARQKRVAMHGNRWENAFTLAHRGVGEWRVWRQLCDANGIEDPLEFRSAIAAEDASIHSPDDVIDFTTELGVSLQVVDHSQGIGSLITLTVQDVAFGVFELRMVREGEVGPPTVLLDADFAGVNPIRVNLVSADLQEWLDVRFNTDVWLVIWLAREITLKLNFAQGTLSRSSVMVPAPERGL